MRKESRAGTLCREPDGEGRDRRLERVGCKYNNECERFLHRRKDFSLQFCHVYGARLEALKERAVEAARALWGCEVPVRKLADLVEDERCIIIGTLAKHQELRPSILKELSDEFQLVPQQKRTKFTSEEDEVVLEDELQRIKLVGEGIEVGRVVTGVVCGVLGRQDGSGKFRVEGAAWPGPGDPPPALYSPPAGAKVLLLSGLDLTRTADLLPLRLLTDYILGSVGEPDQQEEASRICLVVLAGNTIGREKGGKVVATSGVEADERPRNTLALVEAWLEELGRSVDVDIVPGERDPTNLQLPQQPLHPAVLGAAGKLTSVRPVTNPYSALVGGRRLVGTDGRPSDDISRYSDLQGLAALEACLRWGHLAPTCPDTLPSYPHSLSDPLVLPSAPHLLFAGNQPSFETSTVSSTRLITLPSFSATSLCVLFSLDNLDCSPLSFSSTHLR